MQSNNKNSEKTILSATRLMFETEKYKQEMEVTVIRNEDGTVDLDKIEAINFKWNTQHGGWIHIYTTDITTVSEEIGCKSDIVLSQFDWNEIYESRQQGPDDLFEMMAIAANPRMHPLFTDILESHGMK